MNSLFYFDTPSYGWVCLLFVRSSVPYVFSLSVTYVQKKTSLQSDVFFGCPVGLEPTTFRTTI